MTSANPLRHLDTVGDLTVLYVMATEQEYGPHLQRLITPLITGVGPVEAATATGAMLGAFYALDQLPDLVFSLGSAGSRTLDHAGIYQIESVAYRDMDASPLGFEPGVTPFLDEPAVIPIPHRIPDIPAASISTGATIISGTAYHRIAADMVDMESYAVLRAARRFGIPMIGLRGISDGKNELSGLHDWTEYLHLIDEKLAAAVEAFGEHVVSGRFVLAGDAGNPGDPPHGPAADPPHGDHRAASQDDAAATVSSVARNPGVTRPSNDDRTSSANEEAMDNPVRSLIPFLAGILATTVGAVIIAVFALMASDSGADRNAMDVAMVDIAAAILSQPPSAETEPAREWAVNMIYEYAEIKPNKAVRDALMEHQALASGRTSTLLADELEQLGDVTGSLRAAGSQ